MIIQNKTLFFKVSEIAIIQSLFTHVGLYYADIFHAKNDTLFIPLKQFDDVMINQIISEINKHLDVVSYLENCLKIA